MRWGWGTPAGAPVCWLPLPTGERLISQQRTWSPLPAPRKQETCRHFRLHSGSHRACAGGGSNPRDTPPSTSPSPQSEPDSRQWERECFQKVRDDCSGLFSTISNNPPHSLSLRPCPERPRALQKESSPALLLDRRYYVPPLTDEETKPTG